MGLQLRRSGENILAQVALVWEMERVAQAVLLELTVRLEALATHAAFRWALLAPGCSLIPMVARNMMQEPSSSLVPPLAHHTIRRSGLPVLPGILAASVQGGVLVIGQLGLGGMPAPSACVSGVRVVRRFMLAALRFRREFQVAQKAGEARRFHSGWLLRLPNSRWHNSPLLILPGPLLHKKLYPRLLLLATANDLNRRQTMFPLHMARQNLRLGKGAPTDLAREGHEMASRSRAAMHYNMAADACLGRRLAAYGARNEAVAPFVLAPVYCQGVAIVERNSAVWASVFARPRVGALYVQIELFTVIKAV